MTVEENTAPPVIRRNVRPSFADDVYGTASGVNEGNSTTHVFDSSGGNLTGRKKPALPQLQQKVEMCESSLAQRRSANLPKLKEIAPDKPSIDCTAKSEMAEIDFRYGDTDKYENELAELYAYSEMEEWAVGMEAYFKYVESRRLDQRWKDLNVNEKKLVIADLLQMIESTEASCRLDAVRLILYILQGAYGDFRNMPEDDNDEVDIDKLNVPPHKGTEAFEKDCFLSAGINAYFCYEQGLFPALCTMLLSEINEPFDVNLCAERSRSRQSSMSNISRAPSNADLADNSMERRSKRSATIADNESIRMVLSSIYHLVEAIRREDWLEELSAKSHYTVNDLLNLQNRFMVELEEPHEVARVPLAIILFDMMPSFVRGTTPHFPMRKVLLLLWKIVLTTLGGYDKLRSEKVKLRQEAGLPQVEDTIEIGSHMQAIRVSFEGDYMNCKYPMVKNRTAHPSRSISRQLACTSNDGSKDEDDPPTESAPVRKRGAGSSDDDEGLPDVEGDDDVVEEKSDTSSNASADDVQESSPPPNVMAGTPTVAGNPPRFAGNIPFQEFTGRGDVTPNAGTPKKVSLPWAPKTRESQVEQFLQQVREKFFGYNLPGDASTLYALPPPVEMSVDALKRHLYKSLSEIQVANDEKYNRFPFTQKEQVPDTPTERLYVYLLPSMCDYFVALLKMLLAALPSSKSRGDALSILSDVLTPETDNNEMLSNSINLDASTRNVLEEHVRVAIDIARHKEVIVKAISGILMILFKWLKLNHIYQYESVGQHLIMLNCVPLLLKFLDQNMVRYIQAKNELPPFNYPTAPLFFARNRDEWPTLSAENVNDPSHESQSYYIWRNVFSSINVVRLLNKVTKGRQPRTMMLVVFKSAPILKRCLRVKCGLFQLYCLKLLKLQCRFLGRQWRKSNMDLMSAIYMRVRHRLNDDWAYANDSRNKQVDFQSEEKELKTAVEKFHSRRYGRIYPQFKLEKSDDCREDGDYFDHSSLDDFIPVDNCLQSVLSFEPIYSERFKRNYDSWLDQEVHKNQIDWDSLLECTKGISEKFANCDDEVLPPPSTVTDAQRQATFESESGGPRERVTTVVGRESVA